VGGINIEDSIRDFLPFTKKTEQAPDDSSIEAVKYKPSKNLFYSIFVILFTDYFELDSKNFSEKILKEKLDQLDNERFSKNLSKFVKLSLLFILLSEIIFPLKSIVLYLIFLSSIHSSTFSCIIFKFTYILLLNRV
jgi:hypothetical protein